MRMYIYIYIWKIRKPPFGNGGFQIGTGGDLFLVETMQMESWESSMLSRPGDTRIRQCTTVHYNRP